MRLVRRLCVALLVVSVPGTQSVTGTQGQHHPSRKLKLSCPNDGFNADDSDPQGRIEGRFDAYSRGSAGIDIVGRLRPKPESFYRDIVNQVIMFGCNVETASERCAEEDSMYAAKDWAGECINAADYTCPIGMCERSSNCYWNSVVEGQNRTTRFPIEDYAKAETELIGDSSDLSLQYNSYAGGIAVFGLVGAAVSLFLLLLWVIFFIGRYFCCCLWTQGFCFLCSPIPRKDGYRVCCDILIPVIFYMIGLVAIGVATSMAFVGNEDISVAASNTFLHADGLVSDLMKFLGRSRLPLENVQDIVIDAAMEAKGIFDGTDFVKEDALKIVASFLGYFSLHSQGLNASNTLEGFDSATSGFDQQVTPITDNVQSLLDTLELDLYDKADFIRDGLIQAMGQLDSFSEQSLVWQGQIYEYEGQELGFREIRQLAVMITFLVAAGLAVLGFFGIVLSKTKLCSLCNYMIKITGFFSAILGSIALLIASLGLSANFLIHDACQISSIVVEDFEPFVGDLVSPAANAAFNDTNLAVALNLTEKVDFQQKLEEGLSQIGEINVTASFEQVLEPLVTINSALGGVSDTTLSILNDAISSKEFPCAFNDTLYTKENVLLPWSVNRPVDVTSYIIRDNFGEPVSFDRLGIESPEDYLNRIYNIAGICSVSSSDCCIYEDPMPATCQSEQSASCDFGGDCIYPCSAVREAIVQGYLAFVQLYDVEMKMTADLGVECPNYDVPCPTEEFKSQYSNMTLVGSIRDYKSKISTTKDSLVDLASTSVGDTMDEVEDFLCNMNISFTETRYNELKEDVCGSMFGGLSQIDIAFWVVGVGLEIIAITCAILSIRMISTSNDDFDILDNSDQGLKPVDLY